MKTAVIYARVSDKKQAEKDLSIPAQLEASREKAAQLEAKVVREFVEPGRSAWYGNRPEFEEAITYCEVNEIDYFITWDTARFSRDHINGPLNRFRLRNAGTRIEYLTVDIDPETDSGFILETVYQLTDELKSRKTSADTKRSMIKNAKAGYFNGGRAPFGYKAVPAADDNKRKRLQIEPSEAVVVERIFALRLQGHGAKTIATIINREGVTNRGKKWNKSTITYLLRNRAVIGQTVFNKKDRKLSRRRSFEDWIIVDSHEPIIATEKWDAIQRLMDTDADAAAHGAHNSEHLFTGMLKCGRCGASLQIETAKGRNKRYSYYNCRAAQKHGECSNRRVPADALDEWLLGEIASRIFTPDLLQSIVAEMRAIAGDWQQQQRRKIQDTEQALEVARRKRARLYDLLESSTPDELNLADIKPRLQEHNGRIRELEASLAQLEQETPPQIPVSDEDVELMQSICQQMLQDTSRPREVRTFLSSFIEKIEVGDHAVDIFYQPDQVLRAVGGGAVHSRAEWLPGRVLLGTARLEVVMPERFHRAA